MLKFLMDWGDFKFVYDSGSESIFKLINTLEEKINRLESIINKNSRNSNKPPSSDGLKKPKPKNLRKKSGRKPGGQPGHKGVTLEMSENPKYTVKHLVDQCTNCSKSLKTEKIIDISKRQVFEIPPIEIEVTEHQSEVKMCSRCGEIVTADFPENVTHKVQYGNRLKSYAVYFSKYQFLPFDRTSEIFKDIFNQPLCKGTLVNANYKCYENLEYIDTTIKDAIIKAKVAHFDESGIRIENKRHWLHSYSTQTLTYYAAHKRRGQIAMDDIGILPFFKGIGVHDFWSSYYHYNFTHALCNTHHLRELIYEYEEENQNWALKMKKFLIEVKKSVEMYKPDHGNIPDKLIKKYEGKYKRIIKEGLKENPPPILKKDEIKKRGKKKQSSAKNLLDRFSKHSKEVLKFMYNFLVPFDNNLAERDIRMAKLHNKISGTFRSKCGANVFCRIRSYISTMKKQKVSVIDAIYSAMEGSPILPEI